MRQEKLPRMRRPNGYWNDATIERELIAWIEKHGKFPGTKDLSEDRKASLADAISNHGGFLAWRTRLGHALNKAPDGYWNDAVIDRDLKAWIAEHGRFPKQSELKKSGRSDLVNGINKSGGLLHWRARLGHAPFQKPSGYWNDEAVIERELKAWITEHGKFPETNDFRRTKATSLAAAISRTGGISAWRVRFGRQVTRKPNGYWEDEANIERELRSWIEMHGRFPTESDLARTSRNDLTDAIVRHGGYPHWRTRLGYDQRQKTPGYWQDEANIERELRSWIEMHGKFPTDYALLRSGDMGLRRAIAITGGINSWRAKLGYGPITPESLREYADVLARVVLALEVADTDSFWSALEKRWTMHELTEAIREFVENGKLDRFRTLVAAD